LRERWENHKAVFSCFAPICRLSVPDQFQCLIVRRCDLNFGPIGELAFTIRHRSANLSQTFDSHGQTPHTAIQRRHFPPPSPVSKNRNTFGRASAIALALAAGVPPRTNLPLLTVSRVGTKIGNNALFVSYRRRSNGDRRMGWQATRFDDENLVLQRVGRAGSDGRLAQRRAREY
jgi:hypothetical protein